MRCIFTERTIVRSIFTSRTIGMTSFSIGTNPTIATNGDPSYHHYNTNGVYL